MARRLECLHVHLCISSYAPAPPIPPAGQGTNSAGNDGLQGRSCLIVTRLFGDVCSPRGRGEGRSVRKNPRTLAEQFIYLRDVRRGTYVSELEL